MGDLCSLLRQDKDEMITQNKKAHFIGVCGAGMSAVAKLLVDYGWQVSGSDDNFYPPVSEYIKKYKIKFIKGYKAKNIPVAADLVVVGKHVRLDEKENAETRAALKSGILVKSYPEVLSELCGKTQNIVIAGSYGKSTCAALIAWCLEHAGKNPSYFIGAIPSTPTESSKKGSGDMFVLEGDEYPSSNWDNSSKFMHYRPGHLLLTSLARDHFNIFKTPEDYKTPFVKLLSLIPKDGLIAACADGEGIKETISKLGLDTQTIFYSTKDNAHWHVANMRLSEISSFDILRGSDFVVNVKTSLLGLHNIENILGAGALLLSSKVITPNEFSEAISLFKAINRRLDKKSDRTLVPIYEGFGSSYLKAKSAIRAVKSHFPDKKLIILFEPHSLSWRSRDALGWYDNVFDGASCVLMYKPPVNNDGGLVLEDIVNRIKKAGYPVEGFDSAQKGLALIEKKIDKNSVVLALSSGGFDGFIDLTVKWLEAKFPLKTNVAN